MTPPAGADRSPVEMAVDLLIHAPLGILVTARDELPGLIAKGRQEATGARFIGKMAVDMGQREAGKVARRVSERLAGLGIVPDPRRSAATTPGPAPGSSAAPAAAKRVDAPGTVPSGPGAGPVAQSLAIPGYDALSAPQVVQRLDGLSDDELESVRAYETATRGRKTILSRIAQIQTAS